ncbi:MAG TPA: RagB/SusD family nutrient uptake outer membrane protein [Longimicrobium sp.]|nr:RagB/SusD family nutrient uptake outer membrane protein [Longimicrobium sp.]
MYKNATRALAVAVGLALAAGACTDLTTEPKSEVTEANVFNEPGSYRAFLAKLYGGLALSGQEGPAGAGDIRGIDEGFSQYVRLLWQMQELPTDEAVIAWNDAGVQELNTQLWGSSNQFLVSMYYRVFFQVSLANQFLRETTDQKLASRGVTGTLAEEIRQYRAEARFLRALSYWHGIDLFGDIPLVTEADALGNVPPKQSTRVEVYNFIVQELNEIRPQLPAAHTGQYGRADQAAASMLLAKLYLNSGVYTGTNRFAEARGAAEAVIGGGYSLDPNFRRIFSADNHTSPEIIFPVPQDGLKTQSYGGTTFLTHASVGGNMAASDYGLDFGWGGLRVKPEVVALFPGTAGPDKRAIFHTSGQTVAINNILNFQDGLAAPKYRNVTSTGAAGSNAGFPDTDYPMFRLADAYLIYAEAVLRGGGGTRAQALQYVNALRQRAYGDASGNIVDAQLTLDFILDERARELMWEGHRRTDLIRYNRFTTAGVWAFKGGVKAGKVTEAFRNLFPLPASELLANPNLKQNPGY